MTNERVEQIIEEATGKNGYAFYLSEEAGKELREAGVTLSIIENGIRWKGTTNWSEATFIDPILAIRWLNDLLSQGVSTTILDLTEYDWETNPYGFQIQDTKQFIDNNVTNSDLLHWSKTP